MSEPSDSSLEPAIIVIFGITGDLSQRYLLPSLYHLTKDGLLNDKTRILGVTRGQMSTEELFDKVELCVNEIDKVCDPVALKSMHERTEMFHMDINDPASYKALLDKLNSVEEKQGQCLNRLYYLSIPPPAYKNVIGLLGQNDLNQSCQHGNAKTRLLVEKPFGLDLPSAEGLIHHINQHFSEEQVFRIDHYMAKETVQNILTFRFENPVFETIWNNQHISKIDIIAKQKIGIEGRANFYEPLGALRDFIQSHLLQILGIILMDQPTSMESDPIHANRKKALEQVEPIPKDKVRERAVRGQYDGYKEEVKNPKSSTETFASLTVYSHDPRWQNVPIILLTGKALDELKTEITITFKGHEESAHNELRFRIQPNEGIELDLITKKPGYNTEVQTTPLEFTYKSGFKNNVRPNAYERVLADAVRGDHTLFATSDEILASWRIVQPVIETWRESSGDLATYKPGSTGPSVPIQ